MSNKTYPYAYTMTPTHDDYPEVAVGHDLPEAYVQSHPEPVWSPQPSIAPTYVSQPQSAYPPSAYGQNGQYTDAVKPGSAAGPGAGAAVGGVMSHDASYQAPGSADPEKTPPPPAAAATVCGISLVLLLSIVIAILSAAVIGLAAGTGVAASNYNDAKSQVRQLKASLSAAQARATPTSSGSSSSGTSTPTDWNSITNGCSDNPGDVNGTRYTSESFDNANFTMYCDKDTNSLAPVYSLFANNFQGCMDACAGWNHYNTTKGKCVGVSFIPEWSVLATALQGHAPGDCYLKPAPLSTHNLTNPNIGGGEVHTGLLVTTSK